MTAGLLQHFRVPDLHASETYAANIIVSLFPKERPPLQMQLVAAIAGHPPPGHAQATSNLVVILPTGRLVECYFAFKKPRQAFFLVCFY